MIFELMTMIGVMTNSMKYDIDTVALTFLPEHEVKIMSRAATEYKLNDKQRALLYCIRKAENGRTGRELGVGSDQKNHPACRYPNSPVRSLLLQSKWASGTIKKRYICGTWVFALTWCPLNAEVWYNNVTFYLRRFGYADSGKQMAK